MKKFKLAKPVYLAIASLVFMLFNDLNIVNITPEKWNAYVTIVAAILIGVGVMVNPLEEIQQEEVQEEKLAE